MRVVRGRESTIEADRDLSRRLLTVASGGESAVRVWVPHRQFAFGRRDTRTAGYEQAREAARKHEFPPIERDVGGRAVAYDGETTIAFARADPVADFREGTDDRYEWTTAAVERTLTAFGVNVEQGEPTETFCPGTHSLSAIDATGRRQKLVGIAQRVQRDAALTAGILLVANRRELATGLDAVYSALGEPLEPATIGGVHAAGSSATPDRLRQAIETALVGDDESVSIESVAEFGSSVADTDQ